MMKTITIFLLHFLLMPVLSSLPTQAQKSEANDWNIRIGGRPTYITKDRFRKDGFFGLDITRNISEVWEAGLGYAVSSVIVPRLKPNNTYESDTTLSHRFDAIVNFHFLPLLGEKTPERIDVYATARIGVRNIFTKYDKRADFFGGLGAAYYVTKNLGAYGEFGWQPLFKGNISGADIKNWRLGVALKF